ncbi:LuxR C-terminal-related transcriptional regulator [Alkalihalobacterium bogoriense]|uniref:LuxR C-terminal-related transcriptional regulator n=1 Tax=Alkalihalobacterium bogoriense TaxID=246272 RepID=UPI00047BD3D5|nr:LuxR C-terminal-related transcriptional regulator [Alkalihalobacterium bogoriense]
MKHQMNELIETYSTVLNLPIYGINRNGIKEFGGSHSHETSLDKIEEFIAIAKYIKKPTIANGLDGEYRYFVTPFIQNQLFLLAGPFNENTLIHSTKMNQTLVEQQEFSLKKLASLHEFLSLLTDQEKKEKIEQTLIETFLSAKRAAGIVNINEYISNIGKQLVPLLDYDFFGYATENTEGMYSINTIKGPNAPLLEGKSFYIGEGLLGNAIITGKEIHWTNNGDEHKINFFLRHQVKPKVIYCAPIFNEGVVVGLFFCGTSVMRDFSTYERNILKLLPTFFSDKITTLSKISNAEYKQIVFDSWVDLIDVYIHSSDLKGFIYKIVDFCSTLTKGHFCCFTFLSGERIYRGRINDDLALSHEKVLDELKKNTTFSRNVDKQWIHQPLYYEGSLYGLLSVELVNDTFINETIVTIEMIAGLIKMNPQHTRNITNEINTINSLNTVVEPSKVKMIDKSIIATEGTKDISEKEIEKLSDLSSVITKLTALTSREKEILKLILDGLNNQEVADTLTISVHTVKNHVTNIFKKLNVTDRVQAMTKIYKIKYGEE